MTQKSGMRIVRRIIPRRLRLWRALVRPAVLQRLASTIQLLSDLRHGAETAVIDAWRPHAAGISGVRRGPRSERGRLVVGRGAGPAGVVDHGRAAGEFRDGRVAMGGVQVRWVEEGGFVVLRRVVIVGWEFDGGCLLQWSMAAWGLRIRALLGVRGSVVRVQRERFVVGRLDQAGRWGRVLRCRAAVCRVDGFQFPVLHHGEQDSRVQELGLLDQAVHKNFRRSHHFLLDKRHHGDVALDLDVLTQIQPVRRRPNAHLRRLPRLVGLVPRNAPIVLQIHPHRSVGVGLQSPGQIVKAAVELYSTGTYPPRAGHELDALLDLVPGGVVLVGGGIARGLGGLILRHQRIEGDDLACDKLVSVIEG
jgi:hypothetical protein